MRPVEKGNIPQMNGIDIVFAEYTEAREFLIQRVGDFCSYCENQITNLAVEHIQPKARHPHLRLEWTNFLLACTNCNSIKNQQQDDNIDYYWADTHNTSLLFEFHPHGALSLSSNLHNSINHQTAQDTMLLTGLNRFGTAASYADRRWIKRAEAWSKANDTFLRFYINNNRPQDYIPSIVAAATSHGFWSVWIKVFFNEQAVKTALINAFNGTFANFETTDIDRN